MGAEESGTHERSATEVRDKSQPIEPWEDGYRTNGREENMEWWYFDATCDDGTTIVVEFTTKAKHPYEPPITPNVTTIIKEPSGEKRRLSRTFDASDFSASIETCDVKMGPNTWKGDLDHYVIHTEDEGIVLDVAFDRSAPSWRPNEGVNFIDDRNTKYTGWLVAVTHGILNGTLSVDGKSREIKGTCYHDHNWGNISLAAFMDHWYWGRAHVSDFTMVFAMFTVKKVFGFEGGKIPLFFLAKGDGILTDDAGPLTLVTRQFAKGPGGTTYPELLDWHWHSEDGDVHMALRDVKLLDAVDMSETLPSWKRPIMRLFGKQFYLDFNAELELTVDLEGVHERLKDSILCEKMVLR